MSKSVYSLILNDDVVAAVDRLAYRNGTSRSEMITRILARSLSVDTPEERIRRILQAATAVLTGEEENFRLGEPSDTSLSLRSALSYKYNPSVRYSVELSRDGNSLGTLRVSMRTQNETLIALMNDFCRRFEQIEGKYLEDVRFRIENGRFLRELALRAEKGADLDAETLGQMISAYIRTFDDCLKLYFREPVGSGDKDSQMEERFRAYLSRHGTAV